MADAMLMIGKLAFAAIGIAVGARLAVTARHERALGLHTVALAAICLGGLGLLALPIGTMLASVGLVLAGEAAVRAGMLLLCVFIAGTFRPGPAGMALAALCAAALVAAIVWDVRAQPSLIVYDYARPSSHANQLSIAVPFAWATAESVALWSRGRRRLRLGLIEPVLVRRYALWSVTTACFVGICLLAIASGIAGEAGARGLAEAAQALRGVLYLVITVCVGLGVFPGVGAPAGAPSGTAP